MKISRCFIKRKKKITQQNNILQRLYSDYVWHKHINKHRTCREKRKHGTKITTVANLNEFTYSQDEQTHSVWLTLWTNIFIHYEFLNYNCGIAVNCKYKHLWCYHKKKKYNPSTNRYMEFGVVLISSFRNRRQNF